MLEPVIGCRLIVLFVFFLYFALFLGYPVSMKNNNKAKDYFKELVGYIATIDDPDKLLRFFEEILTPSERDKLALRWELMVMLAYGFTQREIADRLGVSLCKVTRGAKILKDPDSVTWELLEKMEEKNEKNLT